MYLKIWILLSTGTVFTWASCQIHKLRVAHAPRMPGMFSRHRAFAISVEIGGGENVPGIPGACTTRNFYVFGKRPIQYFSRHRHITWILIYKKMEQHDTFFPLPMMLMLPMLSTLTVHASLWCIKKPVALWYWTQMLRIYCTESANNIAHFKSLGLKNTMWRHGSVTRLDKINPPLSDITEPLPERMLIHCQLDTKRNNFSEIWMKIRKR